MASGARVPILWGGEAIAGHGLHGQFAYVVLLVDLEC